MDKQRYDKGGTAGSKGVQFQVNLSTVFLLNALRSLTNWRLSTEDKRAGKFDDVVLEWPHGAVLLQAKHRENKKKRITVEELMATTSKNDDFSLPKYFFSYEEIKDKFMLKYVIVCTNAGVNERALKFLNRQKDSAESMMYCADDSSSFYTCKEDVLSELKEKTKLYCQQNLQKKGIDESVVTDENLRSYLEHLQLYFDFDDLEKVIEKLLRMTGLLGKVSPLEIYCKVMDWFQQKDGHYLNETQAKAMFSEIRRDKYLQELERYEVFFQNDLDFQNLKNVYHFTADGTSLLQEIRVYRALHAIEKKVLCIYPDDTVEDQKLLLDAFGLNNYVYLIIIWPELQEECIINEMHDKIKEILEKYKYKKVVLLTDNNNKLFRQIELSISNSIDVTREPPTFQDLLEDTQNKLLKKKKIIFQENAVDLEELFSPEKVNDYETALSSEILERLVKNEEIKVASKLGLLEESIRYLYVPRNLLRKDETTEEENIFDVREKTILISDIAGTGKTTILTRLAMIIKEKNPHLWVLRIELSHYSKILKDLHRRERKTIGLQELLDSQDATRLVHPFEKFIFSMNNKVVLMLDGIDEISPIYTELIMNLLVDCQKAPNLAKILITTRPHLTEELQKNLQVECFTLQPFTKKNQLDFLVTYWSHNIAQEHFNKEKCERYAEALTSKMCSWTKSNSIDGNQFAAVPLHLRMLAEIFQGKNRSEEVVDWEGCEEFLKADTLEPKLPKKIDISSLYKMFLETKQIIFVDKGNPSGIAIAEQALIDKFQECLDYHQTLALEVILDKNQYNLFTCYKKGSKNLLTYVLSIGIVQEVDNGLHFVHRTFAEYFVAKCLLEELQHLNQNAEFQKLLIDDILRDFEFKVVRNFFDSLLQNFVDALPCEIFQNYQSLSYEIEQHKYNFHNVGHELAGEGCVATLRLLLKCVNFKIIRNKETTIYDLYRKVPTLSSTGNRLSILQFFVQRGGVNIRDIAFQTPLHFAARGGHLEMVKFLIEQGARVNVKDREGHTPLYEAVNGGHLDVVEFLVEKKAVVGVKVSQRCNVLYEAIARNHTSIVACLLERILERDGVECGLDPKYSMVPFAAAYLGRLDILIHLVEKGLNVNCTIMNRKPLIFGAAQGGQLETTEYLHNQGANVNSKDLTGNTVLHAISNNSSLIPIAKFLVELGICIDIKNSNGMTALHRAAESGALKMAELLIKSNADVNSKDEKHNRTILHTAALNARFTIVRLLAKHGADINSKDGRGDAVLHLLAKRGQLETIQCLAKFNVDFTVKDNKDNTPLQVALINKRFDVARFLVQCGSDVNGRNKDGQTALHLAVSVSTGQNTKSTVKVVSDDSMDHNSIHSDILARRDIVRCFVDHNADFNARNGTGQTVLHAAILSFALDFDFYPSKSHCDRCSSVVKFLIDRGAIIDMENSNGDILVTLASELRESSRYSGKSLEDVLQLPIFRLVEATLPINDKSGDLAGFGGTSSTSACIVEE